MEERYRQEKWLFAFFMEGLSAIECLYYGLYFLGAIADPQNFDTGINRRDVNPGFVATRFAEAFPSDLSTKLAEVDGSDEIKLWRLVRNVLTHRGIPPRQHSLGEASVWGFSEVPSLSDAASRLLDPDQILERRKGVGAAVGAIVEAAVPFVETRVHVTSAES
jgi:hypothetical protein